MRPWGFGHARGAVTALLLSGALTATAQQPPVVTRSRIDPSRSVNFHVMLIPDTVYVGQQTTYQIGVFLNQDVRQRLRRNPEFVPPETRALLVYDMPDAPTPLVQEINGRSYEVHVFQRAFFALSPGRYAIPPSRLTYALPQTPSFFSREESHSLRSRALTLTVLPVPTAGRPSDWAGAVGEWRTQLRLDSLSGRVGDPIVVTLRVEGRGNVALLPRPRFAVEWATAVAADERVRLDSTPTTLRGVKEFDWLVTPRLAGRRTIPSQRYAFFNPSSRQFEMAWSAPATLMIAGGDEVTADTTGAPAPAPVDTAVARAALTLRPSIGNAVRWSWIRSPWYIALLVLAPWPALAGVFRHRRRKPRPAPTAAHQLQAAAKGRTCDSATLRRLSHDALRERVGFDVGLALVEGTLVVALRHEGVTHATASHAEALLRRLDVAVFGAASGRDAPSAAELWALLGAVDGEARAVKETKSRLGKGHVTAVVALIVAMSATAALHALQGDDMTKRWATAQTAFAGGAYDKATRLFLDVARERRDHPDVWANVGTAAWMASDTARAVQGWQRALRRTPLNVELRSRLAMVRAVQERGFARVSYVAILVPPMVLLSVWLAGWIWLARRAWMKRRIRLPAITLVLAGSALASWAIVLDAQQRAHGLAVVAHTEPLRTLPVLGADQGAAPLTGEVARVIERQGAWVRIRLDGDREGWMSVDLVLPLSDD